MANSSIHHVEIGITGGYKTVEKFLSEYPFQLIGRRCGEAVTQWIVCNSNKLLRFVFTDIHCLERINDDPYSVYWKYYRTKNEPENGCYNDIISKSEPFKNNSLLDNSVFNVALEVQNVQSLSQKMALNGVEILKEFKSISDNHGHVDVCVVKSVVGNVMHTLINSENYHGIFLPGFLPICEPNQGLKIDDVNISHIDHITFACEVGASSSIIQWYETNFCMKRFFLNR